MEKSITDLRIDVTSPSNSNAKDANDNVSDSKPSPYRNFDDAHDNTGGTNDGFHFRGALTICLCRTKHLFLPPEIELFPPTLETRTSL